MTVSTGVRAPLGPSDHQPLARNLASTDAAGQTVAPPSCLIWSPRWSCRAHSELVHRLRLVLLPVAVLLTTLPGVARADGPPPPRVVSVSAPATSPLGADALDSWQVQLATDSGQPLAEVSLTFRLQGAPSGASEVAPLIASWSSGSGPPPTADGTVTVTGRSSRHQAAGHFELTTVTARDATGGQGGAGRGGQVPLAQADVDVVNPDGDATPRACQMVCVRTCGPTLRCCPR